MRIFIKLSLIAAAAFAMTFMAKAAPVIASPEAKAEIQQLIAAGTMDGSECHGMIATVSGGVLTCESAPEFAVKLDREKWDGKDQSRIGDKQIDVNQPAQYATAYAGTGGSITGAKVEDVLTPTPADVAAAKAEVAPAAEVDVQAMPVPSKAKRSKKTKTQAKAPAKKLVAKKKAPKKRLTRNQCLDLAHLRGASNAQLKAVGCEIPKRAAAVVQPQTTCEATVTTGIFRKKTVTHEFAC